MKVSSRLGDLSGCTVWVPPIPRRSPPTRGLRTVPSRPACGPGSPGRCAVAGPWRRLGPGRPGYLGAREGGRGPALAQPGLGGLGKFPHYRCQLTMALMSPSAPGPCRGGEGRWGRRTGLSSAVRAGGPPSLISSVLRRPCCLPANFH